MSMYSHIAKLLLVVALIVAVGQAVGEEGTGHFQLGALRGAQGDDREPAFGA